MQRKPQKKWLRSLCREIESTYRWVLRTPFHIYVSKYDDMCARHVCVDIWLKKNLPTWRKKHSAIFSLLSAILFICLPVFLLPSSSSSRFLFFLFSNYQIYCYPVDFHACISSFCITQCVCVCVCGVTQRVLTTRYAWSVTFHMMSHCYDIVIRIATSILGSYILYILSRFKVLSLFESHF